MGEKRAPITRRVCNVETRGKELGSGGIDERAFRERVCLRARWGGACVGWGSLMKLCYGGYAERGCTTCDLFPPGTGGILGCYSNAVGQCRTAVSLCSNDCLEHYDAVLFHSQNSAHLV